MNYIKYWLLIDGAKNQEIQELRNLIANLTQRIGNLAEKSTDYEEPLFNESRMRGMSRMTDNRSNRSLSPVLIREKKREMPPMSDNYKKTLHVNIHLY